MSGSTRPDALASGLFLAFVLCLPAHAEEFPETILIDEGPFATGSSQQEREAAYRLDEKAYGHSVTRKNGWYDGEAKRRTISLPAFRITRNLITNNEYARFVRATGHRTPDAGIEEWKSYRLIHPYERTRRHAWKNGAPPEGRGNHPVVMVSYDDALAYANWLSRTSGKTWRLPTEHEWEKAARGTKGFIFPWGNEYDPAKLNSHDAGPFDTLPVASFPEGKSPFGLVDAAGQVFEWTSTPSGKNRFRVKGGSWDDKGCGVCRPAARHARPRFLKHILVGFRLVQDTLTVK
ncbi:MAG: formylglycine-generating enzyme family protein [Hyphomicrobiales bacterium]